MIKYLRVVAALALLCLILPTVALSQSWHWSPSKIFYEYDGCAPDTTVTFWLVNESDNGVAITDFSSVLNFWQIVEHPSLPLTLKPDDSIKFTLKALHAPYAGTFNSFIAPASDPSTRLDIQLKYHAPSLTTSPITIEIDSTSTGDTAKRVVLLTNEGDRDFTFRSFSTSDWFPNTLLTGIQPGDVIPAGSSRPITLLIWALGRQPVFGSVNLHDECYTRIVQVSGSFVPEGPQWADIMLDDFVTGCDTGSYHTLVLTNDLAQPEKVDSIRFGEYMESWSFVDGNLDGIEIQSGNELHVRMHRDVFATGSGMVILYPHDRPSDTAWVELSILSPFIFFNTPDDTAIYQVDPDKPRHLSVFVMNYGVEDTWLEDVNVTHNDGWLLTSFDYGRKLSQYEESPVNFTFPGTTVEGDHAITFTVRNTCGQSITQTLIARVGIQSDVAKVKPRDVSIYPTMATSHVMINGASEIRYRLLDLLGREMMSGDARDDVKLDVSMLPRTSYILVVDTDGGRVSRVVKLVE